VAGLRNSWRLIVEPDRQQPVKRSLAASGHRRCGTNHAMATPIDVFEAIAEDLDEGEAPIIDEMHTTAPLAEKGKPQ